MFLPPNIGRLFVQPRSSLAPWNSGIFFPFKLINLNIDTIFERCLFKTESQAYFSDNHSRRKNNCKRQWRTTFSLKFKQLIKTIFICNIFSLLLLSSFFRYRVMSRFFAVVLKKKNLSVQLAAKG